MSDNTLDWIRGISTAVAIFLLMIFTHTCVPPTPVHAAHWPDVPMTSTACEKIQALPLDDESVSFLSYNSINGMLIAVYQFADGTIIETTWIVNDLAHEQAADYSIKLPRHLAWYTFRYKTIFERWVDQGGNGDCKDFQLKSISPGISK